jgi:hypothetical protein
MSAPSGRAGLAETVKKGFHGDDLQQPGNHLQELEDSESQAIVAAVIRAGLAGEEIPKAPRPRSRKHLRSPVPVELAIDSHQSMSV